MSATRAQANVDDEEKTPVGSPTHKGLAAEAIGALGVGLSKLFGNLLPAAFKSATIKDTATQILSTPLGGKILSTYTTEVSVVGAPEVILAIEAAKEETERAQIAADAEIELAKNEAAGHHEVAE